MSMKHIISTTGSKIKFRLNKNRNFIFDPIVPTEVHDSEFDVLKKRLGAQLKVVNVSENENNVILPKSDIDLIEAGVSTIDSSHVEKKVEIPDVEDENEKS